jgi:hypothetical protein
MNVDIVQLPSESPFPIIQIKHGNNPQLTVQLVGLSAWKQATSADRDAFDSVSIGIRKSGLTFVCLWEDCWIRNREIVESRIRAILGYSNRIPARVTQVRRISKIQAQEFLAKNHLQGPMVGKFRYGLFLPAKYFRLTPFLQIENDVELLVAVATFSPPKIFKKDGTEHRSYELVRFANRLETLVVGGLAKLLTAFVVERHPDDIMTYADLDWSEGKSYTRLGFYEISDTPHHHFRIDEATFSRTSVIEPSAITVIENEPDAILIRNSGSRKFVKKYKRSSE